MESCLAQIAYHMQARRKTLQQYQKMQAKLVTANLEAMGGIQQVRDVNLVADPTFVCTLLIRPGFDGFRLRIGSYKI